MGKYYFPGLGQLCSFSDDHGLISSLSVNTELAEDDSLHQSPLPSSASPVASEDPSDDPLSDIFSRLL
jgi:hypothetical protein